MSKIDRAKNKPRWHLLPWRCLEQVVLVFESGLRHYKENDWQTVPDARTVYYDSAMRHITDWWCGLEKDKDSGLHPLAHAIACLLILMWHDRHDSTDDKC